MKFILCNSVQSFSHVWLFATPWTAACQASLSVTNSWSLLKLLSIKSVMSSSHLILCHPLFLLPSIFPSIKVFSNCHLFTSGGQSIGVSASGSVFPTNIQDWFLLELIGLISLLSKELSGVFSSIQFEGINSLVFCLLYSPTLKTMCDHWKDLQTWGTHLLVSYLFGLLYSSWGSYGKYTGVVCHSFLQWIMFCQHSLLWPICLEWPCTAWLIASLNYASLFTTIKLWSMRGISTAKALSRLLIFSK